MESQTDKPLYGRGFPQELIESQLIQNAHDDLVYAMALGALAQYKRPKWYRRLWRRMKGWWRWFLNF